MRTLKTNDAELHHSVSRLLAGLDIADAEGQSGNAPIAVVVLTPEQPSAPCQFAALHRRLVLKEGRSFIAVTLGDILFAEAGKRRTILHLTTSELQVDRSLSRLEEQIGSGVFVRSHNSYLVNVTHVRAVHPRGDRSFEISFWNSSKTAWVSRSRAPYLIKALHTTCEQIPRTCLWSGDSNR